MDLPYSIMCVLKKVKEKRRGLSSFIETWVSMLHAEHFDVQPFLLVLSFLPICKIEEREC